MNTGLFVFGRIRILQEGFDFLNKKVWVIELNEMSRLWCKHHLVLRHCCNFRETIFLCDISPGHRNKGFSQIMIDHVLRFGFQELELNRIGLSVFDFNKPAIKCYKKLGFTLEGTLRESARVNNSFWNCHMMSILRKEWHRQNSSQSHL